MKRIESTPYYKNESKNKKVIDAAVESIENNGYQLIEFWVEDRTFKVKYDDRLEVGSIYVERKVSVFEKNNNAEKLKSFLLTAALTLVTALLAGLAAYAYLIALIAENR